LFSNATWRSSVAVDGYEAQPDEDPQAHANMITPGYFDTMSIPVVSGRTLDSNDREGAPLVAVVNETFAERYFGGRSAIGGRFGMSGDESSRDIEVVGVVRDLKYNDLREETPPLVYFPVGQNLTFLHSLEVKAGGDPALVTTEIRQMVQKVAGHLPIVEVTTLDEQVDRSLRQEKLISKLTGFFGLLALVLASIGVYGVLAFGVAQRTNEIGIRMAFGARRFDVVWMILKDGTSLVSIGVAVGILAALGTTHFVSSLLFGLTEKDPVTLFAATAVLVSVSLFAGYLPARRASRLDPLEALRYE
jgi:predicted permease